MNNAGKYNNSSNTKKILSSITAIGITIGLLCYYRIKHKKTESLILDKEEPMDDQSTVNNDNETNFIGDDLINELIHGINEEPIFGPEDLYINENEDDDFDENNPSYVLVDYIGKDLLKKNEDDPYISIIIKTEDTLYSKNRNKEFYDRDIILKDLRDLLFSIKSNRGFKGLKFKVEPLSFYFYSEGIPGELMDIKDMRDLKSITGFRYIRIKVLDTSSLGVKFTKEVLKSLHPNGGEEDSKFNISPFVINYDSGGIRQLKDNYISSDYLDNGERFSK